MSSDQQRLARAFGRRKQGKKLPIAIGATGLIIASATWFGWVFVGGIAAGMGGDALEGRLVVKRGLREVERWGFPVVGYREWLLAEEPTFEIELARDLDPEVLITSAKAIDPTVKVARVRDRTFQLTTRRAALPPQRGDTKPVLVGDRELLMLLHERLLAPLHADVGIRRMRMGDRLHMPAATPLLPAGAPEGSESTEGTSMGAFRDAALAAPPALQALVYSGGDRELPDEAKDAKQREERVVYAIGASPHGAGTVAAFTFGGVLTTAAWLGPIGFGLGVVGGAIGGAIAVVQGNRRNARKIAASVDGHGYPIAGYDSWLICGRPIFDIELAAPLDPATLATMLEKLPKAFSVSANAEVSWVVDVRWLNDRLVRLETRPTLIEPSSKIEPFYGGSHAMFEAFREKVLVPLHRDVGIASIKMGGYLNRRV